LELSEKWKIEYLNKKISYLWDFVVELEKINFSKKEKLKVILDFIYLKPDKLIKENLKLKEIYDKHKKAEAEKFTINLLKQTWKLEKISASNFKDLKQKIEKNLEKIFKHITEKKQGLRFDSLVKEEIEYEKLLEIINKIEQINIINLTCPDIKFKIYDKIVWTDFATLLVKELFVKDWIYLETKSFLWNLLIEKYPQKYQEFLKTKPKIEVNLDKALVKNLLEKVIKKDLKEFESYLPKDADKRILNLSMSVLYNMIYSEKLKDKFADYLKENQINGEILNTYLQNRKILEQFHIKTISEYAWSAIAIWLSLYFFEVSSRKLAILKRIKIFKTLVEKYPKAVKMVDLFRWWVEVDFYYTMLVNKWSLQSRFEAYKKYLGTKEQFYNLLWVIYLVHVWWRINFSRQWMYVEFGKDTMLYYLYSELVKTLNNINYDMWEDKMSILDIAIQMVWVYAVRIKKK